MSQSNSDSITPPVASKTVDDIFAGLSDGDDQDTLDLTKPIKDKDAKAKDDDKDKVLEEPELDADGNPVKEKDDEEVDELALLEEDLEEIDEEKLELVTAVPRREILKKYPNVFKDFPYLEKAYYRDQQYTELLPTIDDAKEAVESHKVLAAYTKDMVEDGNVSNVLKMIRDSNPETYARVVDDYMEHLQRIDKDAYTHVQSNLVKNIIAGMVDESKSSGDDDYRLAALLLNKWAFGSSKYTPPQKLAKDVKPEDKGKETELSKREQEFNQRQMDTAMTEVSTRINNAIKGAIDTNIDPNGSMTEYVKKHAISDALNKVNNLIQKDTRFQKIVDKLWEKSAKDNYSRASQDEIRKAFLSKAKSLLAPVIKSARNEALKGMGKKVKDDTADKDTDTEPQRQRVNRSDSDRTERRPSSGDKDRAKLDELAGRSSYDRLNALMGD